MIITSTNPYYDDFDESKKYQRILFKPGYAVQARELTQIQTIIQSQLERFGKHIFDEGSLVTGGQFDIDNNVPYVVLNPVRPGATNVTINLSELEGKMIQGGTTDVKAFVLKTGYFVLNPDTDELVPTLFIRYVSGGQNGLYSEFIQGEILTDVDNTTSAVIATKWGDLAFGKGSLFTIEDGTIFTHGFFANFLKQTIVTSAFSQTPTCRAGFFIDKLLITSDDDDSLLDNAQGYPNYAAPGADRLKIDPVLSLIDIDNTAALPEFVELFTIREGVVQRKFERSQYAVIGDEIAKRTFDESGDYCVRGMGVNIREHLDTGVNEGYLTKERGGDPDLLAIGIDPGLAYVKGYEVGTLVTSYITTSKSIDYNYVNSQVLSTRSGGFLVIKEIVGFPEFDKGAEISFYNQAETRVSKRINSLASPSGTKIGTAKVKSVVYERGKLGTADAELRIYLCDIAFTSGNLSNARAVYCANPAFFADIVTVDTVVNGYTIKNVLLQDTASTPLLYNVGSKYTRTIRSNTGESDTTFTFQRSTLNFSTDDFGKFTLALNTSDETFGYGVGAPLSSSEKETLFVVLNEAVTIPLFGDTGKVAGSAGSDVLIGTSTFFNYLNVGDKIQIEGVGPTYTIKTISSNTSLTVDKAFTDPFDTKKISKVFLAGDYIDLNGRKSVDGSTRVAELTSSTSLYCDLGENFERSVSVSVGYLVTRKNAFEIIKELKPNRYVRIDCSKLSSLTNAINLGFSDVFKIHKIEKSSNIDDFSEALDVTSSFIFDNGQRDDLYDHASITPIQSFKLASTDCLLVKLDYFNPVFSQGFGYFSIDSYPVDDTEERDDAIYTHEIPKYKSVTTGVTYNLRDYVDCRPVKTNTATDTIAIAESKINPDKSTTFVSGNSAGLRLPYPSSQMLIDYSYYLARRDVVVLDINGTFNVIQGVPSTNPVTPDIPDNVMGIAKIFIPPYPSLSNTYARIIQRPDMACEISKITFARYTMRDIGSIKQRVDNLEYYNSVNLLEKSATDLTVLDEDGLDRFKNGFFVDGFLDQSLGATDNSDYNIAVDKQEQVLRPIFEVDSFSYDYILNHPESIHIQKTGSTITLPYVEEMFLEQSKVTTYRNIEQSVFRFIGKIELTPDTDNWVDTTTYDKTITIDLTQNIPPFQTVWDSWSSVTGYNVYQQSGGWTGLQLVDGSLNATAVQTGTYTDYASALAAVKNNVSYGGGLSQYGGHLNGVLETVTTENRTGLNLTANTVTDTEQLGTFVTDVSLATYIRPQVIKVYAKGVKANTLFHIFFDGEKMNDYLTPMIIPETGPKDARLFLSEGSDWVSDSYGDLLGFLRLPVAGKKFRTGTKEVRVTDSPDNTIDATTYADGYFVAQGLIQQKQNTILSTKATVVIPELVTETRTTQTVQVMGPSCMAYSFYVQAPADEDGVFLTSVDVWIKAVDTANKLGVWFEIREMNSAGGITRTQVPYSEVWFKYNPSTTKFDDGRGTEIKFYDPEKTELSNIDTQYTRIKFVSPVFLMNNTQYAFIIHTEGLNPNTYFWISRLGGTDVITGQQVTSRQLTGNVYTTNNNLNWDIVPDIDLKVRFNRAKFDISKNGIAIFGNAPYEFCTLEPASDAFVYYGEQISGSQKLVLSNIANGTIAVNDVLISGNVTGKVVGVGTNNTYHTTGTLFAANMNLTVKDKQTTATISSVNSGSATLSMYNRNTNIMRLIDSNGGFFEKAVITDARKSTSSPIKSIDKFNYETIQFNPNYLIFNKTSCNFKIKSILSTGEPDSDYSKIIPKTNFSFTNSRAIFSRSVELASYSGKPSSQACAMLSSTSNWVSPILDTNRTSVTVVSNKINDDVFGEDEAKGGKLINKYISKTVTLAEGQDAEDLLVAITGYCPPEITSLYPVKVWAKLWNSEDTAENIEKKKWIEMDYAKEKVYSSLTNMYDFKSIDFKIPSAMMKGPAGEVQYSNVGTFWKPSTQVELDQVVYVIDDEFETGEYKYRHYKVVKAGTTGLTSPVKLSGKVTDGTAELVAQYEKFGKDWAALKLSEDERDRDVAVGDILYVANADNNGYRHYRVVTAGNLGRDTPLPDDDNLFPDPENDVFGTVKIEGYLPTNGNLYNGFKQFAVKIGLLGSNPAIVPRVGDLRVIALQM